MGKFRKKHVENPDPRCRVGSFRLRNNNDNEPGNYWTIWGLSLPNPWAGLFKRENTPIEGARKAARVHFLSVKWVRVHDEAA